MPTMSTGGKQRSRLFITTVLLVEERKGAFSVLDTVRGKLHAGYWCGGTEVAIGTAATSGPTNLILADLRTSEKALARRAYLLIGDLMDSFRRRDVGLRQGGFHVPAGVLCR